MKKNEGKVDRSARILLGLVMFAAGLYFQTWFGLLGAIPFLTGITGYCPLYTLIGLNTCILD